MYRKYHLKLWADKCQPFFTDLDGLEFLMENMMPTTDRQETESLCIHGAGKIFNFRQAKRKRRGSELVPPLPVSCHGERRCLWVN